MDSYGGNREQFKRKTGKEGGGGFILIIIIIIIIIICGKYIEAPPTSDATVWTPQMSSGKALGKETRIPWAGEGGE